MSNSPLFLGLAEEEVASLVGLAELRSCAAGEVIVREGTPSDCLFTLASGSVAVEGDGGAVELSRLSEPGDFFGEMSLIDTRPRSADIRACEPVEVTAFPKALLASLFTESPRMQMTLILNIARHLSLRLRQADARIVAVSRGR